MLGYLCFCWGNFPVECWFSPEIAENALHHFFSFPNHAQRALTIFTFFITVFTISIHENVEIKVFFSFKIVLFVVFQIFYAKNALLIKHIKEPITTKFGEQIWNDFSVEFYINGITFSFFLKIFEFILKSYQYFCRENFLDVNFL